MRKILSLGDCYVLSVGLLLVASEAGTSSLAGVFEEAESGIPRQNLTSADKPSDNRATEIPQPSGDEQTEVSTGRKMDDSYFFGWGALNSSLPRSSNRSVVRKIITIADKKNLSRDANSAYKVMMVHRRFSNRKSYPENHRSGQPPAQQPPEEPKRAYATVENVDEQLPMYASEYAVPPNQEYEENYNAIPPEDQSNSGYTDNAVSEPWRVNYIPQEPPYYGPYLGPPNPYSEDSTVLSGGGECSCPSTTRQMDTCESPGSSFLNLMGTLGQNLWALIQLIATSSLPFIIPLLAAKLVLVPLGILKFLKLIKLFVKFFILVPFFVRVIYPALSESFNLQDLLFQKPQHQHLHEHNIHGHHEADSRRDYLNLNSSSVFESDGASWDLSRCPSRVACEFAAYLAGSTLTHFPQNLTDFLARKADRAQSKETSKGADNDDDGADEENDQMHRSEPFRAFVIALGRKWAQDKCEAEYYCPLPFTSSNSFFF